MAFLEPSKADKLLGDTLASNVIHSSLTSVGTLTNLTVVNPIVGNITGHAASADNANTAYALENAITINGIAFDGSTDIMIDKADVGLGNVDNTSDATKNSAVAALTNKTINADNNTITNIDNNDIKSNAAIDATKIANGTVSNTAFQYLANATSDIQTQLNNKIDSSEKGANNGVATLDGGGKIPASQLPSTVMEYKGNWNASTNTPTLANGSGNAGDIYRASVAGSTNFGAGSIPFDVGDWAVYNGSIWEKSINSNNITSVNGQTGVVSLTASDVGAQSADTDLTAVANLTSTGLIARTGSGTATTRTIQAPAAGITVSNGNGVAGDPTLALANDLAALEALSSTGISVRSATDTWVQRSVAVSGSGLSVANADGSAGNPTISFSSQTANTVLAGPSSGGAATPSFRSLVSADIPVNIQTFTASGTWTKPTGVKVVHITCIGGGGGGASGGRHTAGSGNGGGGGGGGATTMMTLPAALLGSTESVVVGNGGSGGASQSSLSTNGSDGSNGGLSSFGNYCLANGGGAGLANGTAGSGGTGQFSGGAGGIGGTVSTSGNGGNGVSVPFAGGGGAGGAGNNTYSGGVGGTTIGTNKAGGTSDTGGDSVTTNLPLPGGGGGGGQSFGIPGTGNAGGTGGRYGGGGGGGACSQNAGGSSGAGGNGSTGIVVVVSY